MIIKNANFCEENFGEDDLYIFAIGYEHRSYHLYDRLREKLSACNSIIFVLDDYKNYPHTARKVEELKNNGVEYVVERYSDSVDVQKRTVGLIRQHIEQDDAVTVHIDYSSMPRSWYCRLPSILESVLRKDDKIFFWYTEGEYPASYEKYPSAGIDSFSFYSGKPSLQIDKNRIHIVALSYDVIRTQAILSITDPSYLVACYAYNPKREGFLDGLRQVNDLILSRAAMTLAMHMDNFEFMLSKLCETTNELLPVGDIILIPDGPKPLIFAMSLVPDIIKKNGVTCLHITRNNDYYEAVDATPSGGVDGFVMCIN